jgi:predicted outer membrane repeat protein
MKDLERTQFSTFIRLAFCLLLSTVLCPYSSRAANFVVNDTYNDIGDANPGDGLALTLDGFTTLRAAIEEANALPGLDEIKATTDTYTCSVVRMLESTLFIEDDLRIYMPSACITFRTGWLTTAYIGENDYTDTRAFHIRSGVTLTLEHIGLSGSDDKGGGMYIEPDARVNLVGSFINGNARLGGGVYNDHGVLILTNSFFPKWQVAPYEDIEYGLTSYIYGEATEAGGAIYNDGGVVIGSGAIGFSADQSGNAQIGGVIYNDGGTVDLDGTPPPVYRFGYLYPAFNFGYIVGGNSSGGGGGIYSRNGVVQLKNIYMERHTATGNGGAIHLDGGTLSMEGLYITGSAALGGAVYVTSGSVHAVRVLVSESTASDAGGGMHLAGGTAVLLNTTFSENTAATNGGGLYVGDGASALLLNTTFSQNIAATGGGLWAGGAGKGEERVRLGNSLLAGNAAPAGVDVWGEVFSLGHNLIGVSEGATGFGVPGDLIGTSAAPLDPRLDSIQEMQRFPEADDLLPVFSLLEDSPARDAGNSALLMDSALLPEPPDYDQRGPGYPRFQGAAVDIGAFEYPLPRVVPKQHSADQDTDGRIRLGELLRVVQFYNLTVFHCDATGEDGYAPGPGDTLCTPHTSDYNPQDWCITLSELLRLIQLHNAPSYYRCDGEDGYCPRLE